MNVKCKTDTPIQFIITELFKIFETFNYSYSRATWVYHRLQPLLFLVLLFTLHPTCLKPAGFYSSFSHC